MSIQELLFILESDQNNPQEVLSAKVLEQYAADIEAIVPYWNAGIFAKADPTIELAIGFLISQYNIWLVNKGMEKTPAFSKRHLN